MCCASYVACQVQRVSELYSEHFYINLLISMYIDYVFIFIVEIKVHNEVEHPFETISRASGDVIFGAWDHCRIHWHISAQ